MFHFDKDPTIKFKHKIRICGLKLLTKELFTVTATVSCTLLQVNSIDRGYLEGKLLSISRKPLKCCDYS